MAAPAMPLTSAPLGQLLRVVSARGGWGIHRKLAEMGLTPGVQIRVVSGQHCGPVLIDLRGSRVGMGRGVAQRVLVEEV
jgi:ferrous iron transport protein A